MSNQNATPEFVIQAPFMGDLINEIKNLRSEVEKLKEKLNPQRAFYTLVEACELKGVSYGTLSTKAYAHLRPNAGKPDSIVCGRERWTWETIQRWSRQSDDELLALAKLKK